MRTPIFFFLILTMATQTGYAQNVIAQWDSIKAATSPVVTTAFADDFDPPYKQPLSAYGWEDGVHISRDGLHLYALYYPGDLASWASFFAQNANTGTVCELYGDTNFIRPYADDYGMDMTTNGLGCDNMLNIDILYATRPSVLDSFATWQLSDMSRAGTLEGSPYPLFSESDPMQIDIILFTSSNNDIWMIRNTAANPTGIATATRLPTPINADATEFNADNPHLERLNGDTLILIYEKYVVASERDFMYSLSYDDGYTWADPIAITTINYGMGQIEHPHLYKDSNAEWYLYFSMECDIYRAQQTTPNNWDSWQLPEMIISRGNALCIGEPTLTTDGDISFVVFYNANTVNNDSTDTYDIDPWYLPKEQTVTSLSTVGQQEHPLVYPIPFEDRLFIEYREPIIGITLFDITGRSVLEKKMPPTRTLTLPLDGLQKGPYLLKIQCNGSVSNVRIMKH